MLVLTRLKGQRFRIKIPQTDDIITLTVLEAQGGKARIGIDAPKTYPIAREDAKKIPEQLDLFNERGVS